MFEPGHERASVARSEHAVVAIERRGRRTAARRLEADPYLDLLPYGALVLSPDARLCRANTRGLQILSACDALKLSAGRVGFLRREYSIRLMQYMESPPSATQRKLTFPVDRAGAARPYVIQLSPLADQRAGSRTMLFLLAVYEPRAGLERSPDLLQSAYGLSAAEARVACELARTGRLVSAAARLGLSANTTRAHSKSIFRKLGVSTQAQLVQLLASGPEG